MTATTGRTIFLVVGSVALISAPSTARAQGNSFNPYGNSGYADYREFGNPSYSSNPALPGQSRIDDEPSITRPRANSYQQYTQELDGTDSDAGSLRRGGSTNMPYYKAYQQLNSRYNRVYRPNEKADRKIDSGMKQRETAYAKALGERDPAKRAKLLLDVERSISDRPATTRPRAATGSATPRANQAGAIPRAPSPFATTPATGDRRIPPAPSPYSNGNVARRPNVAAPATRAPASPRAATTPTTPRTEAPSPTATDPATVPIPAPR